MKFVSDSKDIPKTFDLISQFLKDRLPGQQSVRLILMLEPEEEDADPDMELYIVTEDGVTPGEKYFSDRTINKLQMLILGLIQSGDAAFAQNQKRIAQINQMLNDARTNGDSARPAYLQELLVLELEQMRIQKMLPVLCAAATGSPMSWYVADVRTVNDGADGEGVYDVISLYGACSVVVNNVKWAIYQNADQVDVRVVEQDWKPSEAEFLHVEDVFI